MAKSKKVEAGQNGTKCPVTLEEFMAGEPTLTIRVGDTAVVVATAREFSSGAFGYFVSEKVVLTVNGKPVKFQLGFNVVAVGSKPSAG